MRSSNPVLGRAFNQRGYAAFDPSTINSDPAALEDLYNTPAASSLRTGRMTIDDVVARTAIMFAVLVTVGAVAWTLNLGGGALMLGFNGGFRLACEAQAVPKTRGQHHDEGGNADDAALAKAHELLKKHRALEDTVERARHYGAMAKDALALFPASPMREALGEVVDFCVSRAH